MDGLLLPAIVSSIRSLKDGSVSVCVETQELSPSKAGELFSFRKKVIMMYLSPKETITQKELDQVNNIDVEVQGKTQSQRMRAVLYLLHQQSPEGYKTFEEFYRFKTEQIIEHLKSKLT
jgi:hypothetical protein